MGKKKIILILRGGLGNQLFQYATAKNIAIKNNANLLLDITSGFQKDQFNRNYALDYFQLSYYSTVSIGLQKLAFLKILKKMGILNLKFLKNILPDFIIENSHNFQRDIRDIEICKTTILYGYFQSEKYFLDNRKIFTTELKIKSDLDQENFELLNMIQKSESVSIHFRRYNSPNSIDTSSFHGLCNAFYYDEAIKYISSRVIKPIYYVFSDDINWAKDYLSKYDIEFIFIENNKFKFHEDFRLMMSCRHNIIANSSFSWWTAWLNDNENKIVISPKKWFNTDEHEYIDVIPGSWIKLGLHYE